jgi:hypothetical protein
VRHGTYKYFGLIKGPFNLTSYLFFTPDGERLYFKNGVEQWNGFDIFGSLCRGAYNMEEKSSA